MEIATRVDRIEELLVQMAESSRRTDERFQELAAAQTQTEATQQRMDTRFEELREVQRATAEQIAASQQRTDTRFEELTATIAASQQRTDTRFEELTAAQQSTEAELRELVLVQRATTDQLARLAQWQQGEAARRLGERYEQRILKRAWTFFNGGIGGSPSANAELRHLNRILNTSPHETPSLLDDVNDIFLADLVWWKGTRCAVVEVSHVVDGEDVNRSRARADLLRSAGVDAFPVVIGEDWKDDPVRDRAHQIGVEWKVGNDLSEGFIAFRRIEP